MLKNQSKFLRIILLTLLTLFVVSKTIVVVHGFSHNQFGSVKILSNETAKDCQICDFVHLQNQIAPASDLVFLATFFCAVFAFRKFDRVKLSYLLRSYSSRAPPVVS